MASSVASTPVRYTSVLGGGGGGGKRQPLSKCKDAFTHDFLRLSIVAIVLLVCLGFITLALYYTRVGVFAPSTPSKTKYTYH